MTAHAAVGVDDDLATGQAAVRLGTALHEAPGRVDEQTITVAGKAVLLQYRPHDFLVHFLTDGFVFDVVRVLRRDHHGVDAVRLAVHVFDRDLGLAVGANPRARRLVAAHPREALRETVRQEDRERHQDVGLAARVAEHHALVACALRSTPIEMSGDCSSIEVITEQVWQSKPKAASV